MMPDETGISLPRGCSLPSSTASLCARILLPIGELLLALCGNRAEPAIANAARAASGSRRSTAFFILLSLPRRTPRPAVWTLEIYESALRGAGLRFLKEPSGLRNRVALPTKGDPCVQLDLGRFWLF